MTEPIDSEQALALLLAAVVGERERIRSGVVALTPLWATALDRWVYLDSDVLAVIDGGSE